MNSELITGFIVLGVLAVCVIALIVIIVKKIISIIKGDSSEKKKEKKSRNEKKIKTPKQHKEPKKQKRNKMYEVNEENGSDEFTTLINKNEIMEEDDDEDTILMWSESSEISIHLISDTTGETYTASCAEQIVIGRKSECDIQITGDKSVSGKHCMIKKVEDDKLIVRDLNSSNGTYLNDSKVNKDEYIADGDTLEVGRTRYTLRLN